VSTRHVAVVAVATAAAMVGGELCALRVCVAEMRVKEEAAAAVKAATEQFLSRLQRGLQDLLDDPEETSYRIPPPLSKVFRDLAYVTSSVHVAGRRRHPWCRAPYSRGGVCYGCDNQSQLG
jgi:hypothetical protein